MKLGNVENKMKNKEYHSVGKKTNGNSIGIPKMVSSRYDEIIHLIMCFIYSENDFICK